MPNEDNQKPKSMSEKLGIPEWLYQHRKERGDYYNTRYSNIVSPGLKRGFWNDREK